MPTPTPASAALASEARLILARIAADPNNAALARQFSQRLGHLADALGESAFKAIVAEVTAPPVPPAPSPGVTPAKPA